MIQLTNTGYYCLEVPEGAYDIEIDKFESHAVLSCKEKDAEAKDGYITVSLNYGSFNELLLECEIIGIASELSEEQAAEIWESVPENQYPAYHHKSKFHWDTGKDFLNSLLESKGCDTKKRWLILKEQNNG